jgi:hypothetical protein
MAAQTQNKRTQYRGHSWLERDSCPRSQRSRERRAFMPQTARPLWSAIHWHTWIKINGFGILYTFNKPGILTVSIHFYIHSNISVPHEMKRTAYVTVHKNSVFRGFTHDLFVWRSVAHLYTKSITAPNEYLFIATFSADCSFAVSW